MKSILVVDDMPIFREPIAASLRGAGYNVVTACNGKEALVKLRAQKADLLLLDIAMPVMDGIACLAELRSDPATRDTPVILLTAISEKKHILAAARFGVQDYLLKSRFSLQELLVRIKKHLTEAPPAAGNPVAPAKAAPAAAPVVPRPAVAAPAAAETPHPADWPKILTRQQTLERLDTIADGKTIAGVVSQVVSIANSPNADLADIIRVINTDPILASRVLQLANSAAFASNKGRVSTVDDAARNVGTRAILNMALSIGIFGAFPPDESDGFNSMRCWQHSFAVADIMTLFVRDKDPLQEGMNHLVGLCHDLGEILLRQHFAEAFATILEFASAHHLPVHAVEAAALGIRHPELLSRLLSRIGLPQPVVHAIREFYDRQSRDQAAGMSQLARSLQTANLVAHGLLLAASSVEVVAPLTRTDWRLLAGDKAPPTIDPVVKRTEILAATNILARLPIKEEQRLVEPLLPRKSVRLLYLRPESFIDLDPLAFALSHLGELTIASDLPPASELAEFDAILAASIRPGAAPANPSELLAATAAAGIPAMPIFLTAPQPDASPLPAHIIQHPYPLPLATLHNWLTQCLPSPQPALQA